MERIPREYLKKMNHYDIEIDHAKLKVTVVNQASLFDDYLSEFKKLLQQQNQTRVVGLDLKRKAPNSEVSLLIICFSYRCLIIQCDDLDKIPASLVSLFNDESTPFVGMETSFEIRLHKTNDDYYCFIHSVKNPCNMCRNYSFKSGLKLGDLASTVLKSPQLLKSGLAEIAGHIDLKTKITSKVGRQTKITPKDHTDLKTKITSTSTSSNEYKWNTPVFSKEQVKELVHDAYYFYLTASKLLEML